MYILLHLMKRYTVFLYLLLLPGVRGEAQVNVQKSDFLSIDDGLSQSTVHSIVQDSEGYMWFGTEDGLNRYDGYRFTIFRHDPRDSTSLPDNSIKSLSVGKTGTLWVGTKKGLSAWDKENELFIRFPKIDSVLGVLESRNCNLVYEDTYGLLWIGTTEGLLQCNTQTGEINIFIHDSTKKEIFSYNDIRSIYEDALGTLWIGTRGELNAFNRDNSSFTVYELPEQSEVFALCANSADKLWLGTFDGNMYEFNKIKGTFTQCKTKEFIDMTKKIFWALHADRDGNLWAGTGGNGLLRYSEDRKMTTYNLYDNYILSLYEDRSNVLWVGTGKGIHKLDKKRKKFKYFTDSSPDSQLARDVWSFYETSDGTVWIGANNGLARYDSHSTTFICTELKGLAITSLIEDKAGVLWIGTSGQGLIGWNRNQRKYQTFKYRPQSPCSLSDYSVTSLCEDHEGDLWIGNNHGLSMLDRTRNSMTWFKNDPKNKNSLSCDQVIFIMEDHSGILWIGTNGGGLNRYDKKNKRFCIYMNESGNLQSLSSNCVQCVYEDTSGILWIGTRQGLNRFDRTADTFTCLNRKDGLPSEVVYGITEDSDGYFWLSTNNGLSRYNQKKKTFRNYTQHDGLQSNEFNHGAFLKNRHGEMFFGGINGFNSFFPGKVEDNLYSPPVVFTDFKLVDRSINLSTLKSHGNTIELQYSDNFFSIEFAALEYSFPAANQYAYMLEGLDKNWVNSGTRRYVSYTNVDPGNYIFRVRGSNSDGVWNMQGASIAIHIIPPYWKTWWFRSLLAFTVLFAMVVGVHRRFNILEQRTKDQQELSRQLLESQENERKRIGIGLHDSLGQNLLVIKNLAVMGLETRKKKKTADGQLGEISTLASQALAEVREISYDLRPHHLDQLGLTGALKSIISRISASSQLTILDDLDDVNNLFPKKEEINVFRIIQESVNNIIKHSRATNATITVKRNKDHVTLIVSDNGIGFDHHQHGFGLTGIAERTRILGGSLEVKSLLGTGTTISVMIPLKGTHAKT
jgi:ligand-binding sensor domain-containing protein/signal transduction histidine kinase